MNDALDLQISMYQEDFTHALTGFSRALTIEPDNLLAKKQVCRRSVVVCTKSTAVGVSAIYLR